MFTIRERSYLRWTRNCNIIKDTSHILFKGGEHPFIFSPLQGEGGGGDGAIVIGQTNKKIRSSKLQQTLRKNMSKAEQTLWYLLQVAKSAV